MSTGTTCCNELSVLYVRVAKITDSGGVGVGGGVEVYCEYRHWHL